MTDENKDCMPRLRFPEFQKAHGWDRKSLGEICKTFSGGTPSTSNKSYYGGDIPFIRSAEIDKTKTELFLTELGLNNSSAKLVNAGDILLALYGANSGEVAISKLSGAINQAILCLRSNQNNFFIFYYLFLNKEYFISKYLQGGQGNFSAEIVKAISIPLPSIPEQQKIADCLSSLDELIAAHEQKRDALVEHKKGMMQRLFPAEGETMPRWRFPEFRQEMEWVTAPVDTLVKTMTPPKKILTEYYEKSGKIPIIDQSKEKISGYTNDDEASINIGSPVIIFGDHTCIVKYIDFNFAQGADGIKILLPLNIVPRFLYEYLCFSPVIPTGYSRHFSILKEKNIYFPSNAEEQQKIADCLSSLDARIEAEEAEIASLREHKLGLMQRLFPQNL